jgi:hypothetical protein
MAGLLLLLFTTPLPKGKGGELIAAARRRLFTTEFRRPVLRGSPSPDQAQAPDPQAVPPS